MGNDYPRWLPFIGFRCLPIDNDGHPSEDGWWESDCFMLEWFGRGMVLFTTNIRQRNRHETTNHD